MPATFEPIATTTLGSAAAGITFNNISSNYTDLRLVLTWIGSNAFETQPYLRFNDDASSAYSITRLFGNGSSVTSNRLSSDNQLDCSAADAGVTSSQWATLTLDIFSYTAAINKTLLLTNSIDKNGSGISLRSVGLWRNTNAITKIYLYGNQDFGANSTMTLYGILKA